MVRGLRGGKGKKVEIERGRFVGATYQKWGVLMGGSVKVGAVTRGEIGKKSANHKNKVMLTQTPGDLTRH